MWMQENNEHSLIRHLEIVDKTRESMQRKKVARIKSTVELQNWRGWRGKQIKLHLACADDIY